MLAGKEPFGIDAVIARLSGDVEFDAQVGFDTLTLGRRQVGGTREAPFFKLELFELFDDALVQMQFARRVAVRVSTLARVVQVPTAEDVLVQKLRCARDKDLLDATDVLVLRDPAELDMDYIRTWCRKHGSEEHLDRTLARLPEVRIYCHASPSANGFKVVVVWPMARLRTLSWLARSTRQL